MNDEKAYRILGLTLFASKTEIKKAYRKLALKFHPDRNPDNQQALSEFKECTLAYKHLSEKNPDFNVRKISTKKKQESVENLEDIFTDVFGFTQEERILGFESPQEIPVSLAELFSGITKKQKVKVYEKCKTCEGIGAKPNTHVTICTHCFGNGRIQIKKAEHPDLKLCPKCSGSGRYVENPCDLCKGFGRQQKIKTQIITIPPRLIIDQPYTLQSMDIDKKQKYDLFVALKLKKHDVFCIEKFDLQCEYPVSKAVLSGGLLEFPSIEGWIKIRIKKKLNLKEPIIVKGYGLRFKPGDKGRADLKIKVLLMEEELAKKAGSLFMKKVVKDNPFYHVKPTSWFSRFF